MRWCVVTSGYSFGTGASRRNVAVRVRSEARSCDQARGQRAVDETKIAAEQVRFLHKHLARARVFQSTFLEVHTRRFNFTANSGSATKTNKNTSNILATYPVYWYATFSQVFR